MALDHLISGEKTKLLPLGARLAGSKTAALFKDRHMEVIRVVLAANKRMPAHRVAGPITVQCIEGQVELGAGNNLITMEAGDFLYLEGGVEHDLHAIQDTSLLVTIVIVN